MHLVCLDTASLQTIMSGWQHIDGFAASKVKRVSRSIRFNPSLERYLCPHQADVHICMYSLDCIRELLGMVDMVISESDWKPAISALTAVCSQRHIKLESERAVKQENGINTERSDGIGDAGEQGVDAVDADAHADRVAAEVRVKQERNAMREEYLSMPTSMLVSLLMSSEDKLKKSQITIKSLRTRVHVLQKATAVVKSKWLKVKGFHRKNNKCRKNDDYHLGKGQTRARLSPWGGLTLPFMQSVSGTSAWRTAAANRTDASRQTVIRWEGRGNACIKYTDKQWFKDNETKLKSGKPRQHCTFACRQDGTNAQVLDNHALHVPLRI